MKPSLLIEKDPNRFEHLPYNDKDYNSVIESIDLFHLIEYIIDLDNDDKNKWVSKAYWDKSKRIKSGVEDLLFIGQLYWAIYSYLIHNEYLIVEDQYYEYNLLRTDKYKTRCEYFNPLEITLYSPILRKLSSESYLESLEKNGWRYYKIGKMYSRVINLKNLVL